MAHVVLLQIAAALLVALGSYLVAGISAGMSSLCGGLCYALPNAAFALRLGLAAKNPENTHPATFFVGEFTKILLTIALMAAVVKWYHNVNWLAFLIAFIVVLKSYFILLFRLPK